MFQKLGTRKGFLGRIYNTLMLRICYVLGVVGMFTSVVWLALHLALRNRVDHSHWS